MRLPLRAAIRGASVQAMLAKGAPAVVKIERPPEASAV
jgi:hypothetical protein